MDCGKFLLTGLRVLQVVIAAGVIGIGAFVLHVSHDIEIRGDVVLRLNSFAIGQVDEWRAFFDAVVKSQSRVWVAVMGACLTFGAAIFTTVSAFSARLRANRWFLIVLEYLAMIAMAAGFAMSLSLTIRLNPLCTPLNPSPSSDLKTFKLMCPIDTGLSIAAGVGWFLLASTAGSSLIQACRNRNEKSCSFEPTASALGMADGYLARPLALRDNIPTIYDPQKPIPSESSINEEKGLKQEAADMGQRDSKSSRRSSRSSVATTVVNASDDEVGPAEISGPLSALDLERQKGERPARPWSEVPVPARKAPARDSLADKRLAEFDFGKEV